MSSVTKRVRQVALVIIALAVVAYGAALVRLMMQETELIFRTAAGRADTRPAFPYTQIDLPRTDGARQFAWRIERAADGTNGNGGNGATDGTNGHGGSALDGSDTSGGGDWVLYLHGNASTVGSRMNVKHYGRLRELGLNVLAPEYRGFNGLEGVPSEQAVAADARAAYDYLRARERVTPDRLLIYGWSLGGAIAVQLASTVEARGVVLEGAPASIVDIGASRYPMFPVRWIIRNPFNVVEQVRGIRAPLLFLHSPEDTVVPFAQGRRLFDAAPAPKTFIEVRGGHIESSELDHEKFYSAVRSFLQATSTPPPSR